MHRHGIPFVFELIRINGCGVLSPVFVFVLALPESVESTVEVESLLDNVVVASRSNRDFS